jgi:hydrogenase maturation protease
MTTDRQRCVLLGIGNPDRGDDAVGRVVARQLRGFSLTNIEVIEHDGEGAALLTQLDGAVAAFVVDASASGAPAGTIRRFDVSAAPLPCLAFGLSTHGFGLAMAIELARTLGQLPPRCIIYAIEGVSFETGAPLSAPVQAAVAEVAQRLLGEITDRTERKDDSLCMKHR